MAEQETALQFCDISDQELSKVVTQKAIDSGYEPLPDEITYQEIKAKIKKNASKKSWIRDMDECRRTRAWRFFKHFKDDGKYSKLVLLGNHPTLAKIRGRSKLTKILCGITELKLDTINSASTGRKKT